MSTHVFEFTGTGKAERIAVQLAIHRGLATIEADDAADDFVERWMELAAESWRMEGRKALVAELDRTEPEWRERKKSRRHGGPRFAGRCSYCLKPSASLERDHIEPFVNGGGDEPDNLTPICRTSNAKKKDRSLLDFVAAGGIS